MSVPDKIRKQVLENPYVPYLVRDATKNGKNFLLSWLQAIEVVAAEQTSDNTGRLAVRFPVLHEYLNPAHTMHGGMHSTFHDVVTSWSLALINKPGFWMKMGTSRTLNTTYIRPALEGDMVVLEAELVHAGKRLCLMRSTLKREKDGALLSTCEHQKVNIDDDVAKI